MEKKAVKSMQPGRHSRQADESKTKPGRQTKACMQSKDSQANTRRSEVAGKHEKAVQQKQAG